MKKILLALLITLILFNCKKRGEDVTPIDQETPPATYSNKIVLNEARIMEDSIRISWSVLDTANFVSYTLLRRDDLGEDLVVINQFYKKDKTVVTDHSVPYSPTVQYQVIGNLSSGKSVESNVITYSRKTIQPLKIAPYDIIYSDNLLYFFEKNGKISIYNKDGVLNKSIATQATIGYCDFGTYNGKKELYVPRNDGGYLYMML